MHASMAEDGSIGRIESTYPNTPQPALSTTSRGAWNVDHIPPPEGHVMPPIRQDPDSANVFGSNLTVNEFE
jgi:hypothetical protein